MKKKLGFLFVLIPLLALFQPDATAQTNHYKIIAHRGGVVDDGTPENSFKALQKAKEKGYWGVEVDMRITKDSVLITHHDKTFKRYFNADKNVSDMTWREISALTSSQGTKVQKLEDVLQFCAANKLNVMLDNKVTGFSESLFTKVINLLDKFHLRDSALMIGTSESTEFFTGKIKLSCTKEQILENMKRKDYSPHNYYLFTTPSPEDAAWARKNNIMVVGVINEWSFRSTADPMQRAKEIAEQIKASQINYIQLDSRFDHFFR